MSTSAIVDEFFSHLVDLLEERREGEERFG